MEKHGSVYPKPLQIKVGEPDMGSFSKITGIRDAQQSFKCAVQNSPVFLALPVWRY